MLTKYYADRLDSNYNLFDPFYLLSDLAWPRGGTTARSRVNYDVSADDSGLTLSVDLPGVKKDDLHVEAIDRTLSIKAKRGEQDISLTYRLSKDYNVDKPDAALEDGVLTLKFDRSKDSSVKSIKVR